VSEDIKTPVVRIEEAVREIGVLLMALAPLDSAFSPNFATAVPMLLLFVALGATLFSYALWLERRRRDV
jgi:hypothetical protein